MIAVDTNVVLRYLLADDMAQHRKAKNLIENKRPALVSDVVLTETIWTLMGKRYALKKVQICTVLRALIGDQGFTFEDSQVVWSALKDYENSKLVRGKSLDFADALIARKAEAVAHTRAVQFEGLYSFDNAVLRLEVGREIQ